MPDFSLPEYASYVALCRELRTTLDDADWYAYTSDLTGPGEFVVSYFGDDSIGHGEPGVDWWVLPELTDWLDMLEEAGVRCAIPTVDWIDNESVNHRAVILSDPAYESYETATYAPTREEAAARLAIEVGAVKVEVVTPIDQASITAWREEHDRVG